MRAEARSSGWGSTLYAPGALAVALLLALVLWGSFRLARRRRCRPLRGYLESHDPDHELPRMIPLFGELLPVVEGTARPHVDAARGTSRQAVFATPDEPRWEPFPQPPSRAVPPIVSVPARRPAGASAPAIPGHLVILQQDGEYVLHARPGREPLIGATIELDEPELYGRFSVEMIAPSPVPGDGRRCAFIQRL